MNNSNNKPDIRKAKDINLEFLIFLFDEPEYTS